MYIDKLDLLLNRLNEALKSGNKEEIKRINRKTENKLQELVESFSDNLHNDISNK